MNFKLYAESDTRRDFLKKLVGGAAAVAKGDLSKVVDTASKMAPKVIYLDLDKLSQDVANYFEEYGDGLYDDASYVASKYKGVSAEKLMSRVYNIVLKNLVGSVCSGHIEYRDFFDAYGDDNFDSSYFLENDLISNKLSDSLTDDDNLSNVIFKFAKNNIPANLSIAGKSIKSIPYMQMNNFMQNFGGVSATQLKSAGKLFEQTADLIAKQMAKNSKSQSISKKEFVVSLSRSKARKVYSALNQLL